MNTISSILFIVVMFFVLVLILSVLVLILAWIAPRGYHISRHIIVANPAQDVFEYVRYLKNQDHYNKWAMMDPQQKKTFTGTDGRPGFIYAWHGNKKAGKGEQEIIELLQNKKVGTEIRFEKPMKAVAHSAFDIETREDGTKITWSMSSKMRYPSNIILLFMNMDKMLGKDIQESLGMLKNNLSIQQN